MGARPSPQHSIDRYPDNDGDYEPGNCRWAMKIGGVDVQELDGGVCWNSGLEIDADGAPNAYGPNNTGLDYTANAGKPGNWYGIVTAPDGAPVVQGPNDPCPGMYVSTTALVDATKPTGDPRRYVDSATIPYLSVPPELIRLLGVRKGDLAWVLWKDAGSAAIVGDVGPHNKIGEGSIALASALGLPSSPRHGGVDFAVRCVVFKNSASTPPWPRDAAEFGLAAAVLLEQWGGTTRLSSL